MRSLKNDSLNGKGDSMNGFIYHITTRLAWLTALKGGTYISDSFSTEGFIHCSKRNQVTRVANTVFHAKTGLVLLEIDGTRLHSDVRWEPGADKPDELFPHIYGPLNLQAVIRVLDMPPGPDGTFDFPPL
jgi:uncharacterized protein (DUF952 family)